MDKCACECVPVCVPVYLTRFFVILPYYYGTLLFFIKKQFILLDLFFKLYLIILSLSLSLSLYIYIYLYN